MLGSVGLAELQLFTTAAYNWSVGISSPGHYHYPRSAQRSVTAHTTNQTRLPWPSIVLLELTCPDLLWSALIH